VKEIKSKDNSLKVICGQFIGVFDGSFTLKEKPSGFIEKIDSLMDKGQIIKNDNTTSVSRVEYNSKDIIIKRYNHKGIIHSIRHTIKKSRAHRGWRYANRLRELNIATAKPLAYIEQRKGFFIWKSYFVTEYLLQDSNIAEKEKLKKIKQVLELVDKIGRFKISHGDLKHTNILITDNGPVLIDLDGIKFHKLNCCYRMKRARDLKRFAKK
jgi:tRNA A-37 threonylcarbamoyl transferase component Bud32